MDRKLIEAQCAHMREIMQDLQFQLSGVRECSTEISNMVDCLDEHVNAAPAPDVWDNPQTVAVIKFRADLRIVCECRTGFIAYVRSDAVRVDDASDLREIANFTRFMARTPVSRLDDADFFVECACEPANTIVYTIMRSV